jgi:hypothetical protein
VFFLCRIKANVSTAALLGVSAPPDNEEELMSFANIVAKCEVKNFCFLGKNGQRWLDSTTAENWNLLLKWKRAQIHDAK